MVISFSSVLRSQGTEAQSASSWNALRFGVREASATSSPSGRRVSLDASAFAIRICARTSSASPGAPYRRASSSASDPPAGPVGGGADGGAEGGADGGAGADGGGLWFPKRPPLGPPSGFLGRPPFFPVSACCLRYSSSSAISRRTLRWNSRPSSSWIFPARLQVRSATLTSLRGICTAACSFETSASRSPPSM